MVPMMYTKVTFHSHSRGWIKVRLTAHQTSFSSQWPQWKGCSTEGESREEKHHCWTQKRPHPKTEKASCPPASALSHKYSSFPRQQQLWKLLWISSWNPHLSLSPCQSTSLSSLLRATAKVKQWDLSPRQRVGSQQTFLLSNTPTFATKPRQHITPADVLETCDINSDCLYWFFHKFFHLPPKQDTQWCSAVLPGSR